MNDQAVLTALLRSDLRSFIWKSFQTILPGTPYLRNWHVDAIVHQLMRVQAGDISRLLINQPPRSLKSICVSVAYVAWLLGHDPTATIREDLRRFKQLMETGEVPTIEGQPRGKRSILNYD